VRFAEEKEYDEKHGEDAERGHAINIFDAQMAMRPRGEIRTHRAANVDHGVINRVADRANVFFRSAGRGADHAGLNQRNAERGQDEDDANEQAERYGVADGSEPRRADGSDQEIGSGEDEIGGREGAAEAHAVGGGSAEDGEEPHHAAEDAGERAGLLRGEI